LLDEKVPIFISRKLYDYINDKVKLSNDEFKTIEDFIEFILMEIFDTDLKQINEDEDKKVIKENLKKLGYF